MSPWSSFEVDILRWSVESLVFTGQALSPPAILSHILCNYPNFTRTELAIRCKLVDVVPTVVCNLQTNLNQQIHVLLNRPPVIVTVPGPVIIDDAALRRAQAQLNAAQELLNDTLKTHAADLKELTGETERLKGLLKTSTEDVARYKDRSELLKKAIVAAGEILARLPDESDLCTAICELNAKSFSTEPDRLIGSTGTPFRPEALSTGNDAPPSELRISDEIDDVDTVMKKLDLSNV